MDTETKKKRPPKLAPLTRLPSSSLSEHENKQNNSSNNSSFGDDCELESCVKIDLDDGREKILIKPNNLIVLEQLGRGQYGIVEKVKHQTRDLLFAVKRVALKPGDDNERRRLLMDVDVLVKSTECENIIKFYGAMIWEGDLWIIMELMDCSLDRFYKLVYSNSSQNTLPAIPETVLGKITSDVLNALSYLYSIKVIHRDIKPSNILINKSGVVKLCDFGISGYLVNSMAVTYEAGCRPYMAPERIDPPKDRQGYDIKSDIWSLGITILEIGTGKYPYYKAKDFFEQLKMICQNDPPQLPADSSYSDECREFVGLCLLKDYKLRPKYDALLQHPFILSNKNEDISKFSNAILTDAIEK